MSERIYIDGKLFLGRVEEQKQFRAALREVLAAPPDETLPYIFLLYGDGGMGKTMLAKRFRDIARTEPPFEGEFQVLWIDWEEERHRSSALQVGRAHIRPETVFDTILAVAINAGWGRDFDAYQRAVKVRNEAQKKAAAALEPSGERDEFAALRDAGASAIAKAVRQTLPMIGETGEKVAQAFLEAGIKVGAEQAAHLRAALENRLRTRLDPEQFNLFLYPNEQLARALADGLKRVAARKPLLIVLDTYEIVDRADIWLREVMRTAGPRVVWVISGRDDLARSRQFGDEYFKGYSEEFPRRLIARDMLQLAQQDLREIFADFAPNRPLNDAEAQAFSRATRGVPLAIAEAAEMWDKGIALADIIGDIDEATPRDQIVNKMTARYFLHVRDAADRIALYALALARGDVEIVRAMLHPSNVETLRWSVSDELRRLEREYASVHYDQARLHDDAEFFLRAYLKEPLQRTDARIKALLQRAIETLRARLEKLQADLPRLEDRCADDDWVKATLDLCDYLFWLDESAAWHHFIPRLVESLAYSRDLRRGLVETAKAWERWLTAGGKKRARVLQAADDAEHTPDELAELLDELTRLERLGYLQGDGSTALTTGGEAERGAILDWQRGKLLYARGKYTEALAAYERAERALPEDGEALRRQLGEALYELAGKFLWPQDTGSAVYSAEAEKILPKVVAWLPEKQGAWYRLGVVSSLAGNYDTALAAYQRAIELDPKYATPHNGIGNVYFDLKQYDAALAAYQRASELDPKLAAPHNGIGNVQRALGNYDAALAAYQRAIELDPKLAAPHYGIGNVYFDLKQYDAALAAYQRAIQLDPKLAAPHNGIGNVYFDLKQYDAALAAYQRAIELDPKLAAPHYGIGNVQYQLGNYDAALAAFQRASELDPKYAAPHNGIGNVYSDLKQYDAALAAYQRAIQLDPKWAAPHDNMGDVYRALGKYKEAIECYQRAAELDPKWATPHNDLGNLYYQLGDYDAALAAYQRAIQLDPTDATPHNGIGNVQRALGNYDAALAAYRRAIQLDPKLAAPHNGIGNVYSDLKQYDAALAAYQRAIELDPKWAAPHNNIANVFVKLGRFDEARREYNERIRLAPDNAFTPLVALGVLARHQGLAESDKHFQDALAQWDAAWRARWQSAAGLLENKAKALLCLSRKDEALQTLKDAIAQMTPGDTIELDDWTLLQTAPAPPEGIEEAIALLKEAQGKRS